MNELDHVTQDQSQDQDQDNKSVIGLVAYIDFSRVFHTVSHKKLPAKLYTYGIRVGVLCLERYLNKRTVSSLETFQIGPYIVLTSNRKSIVASSTIWFPPYFHLRFGRK